MAILISGSQLGVITGGPSSLNLEDLHDVLVSTAYTGQYLRYNEATSEWENVYITSDVYGYLNTSLTGANGVSLTKDPVLNTVGISLSLSLSGDATGSVSGGVLPVTLASVAADVGTFGSSTLIPVITVDAKGRVTSVTTESFAGTAPLATSIAGGSTGALPYQTAPATTGFLSAGTSSQVLVSGATPSWTNTPTLTGTNFTGVPNSALTNNSLTLGSTSMALGSTTTTVAGLTSVTSTTFVGALTGNASTATTATNVAGGAAGSVVYQTAGSTSATLANGTSNQVLVSGTTPSWTNAPELTGTNFISIPNSALSNNTITIGSTSTALGATSTSLAGLSSVTSTTFVGALTGNASTATTAGTVTTAAQPNITSVGTLSSLGVTGTVTAGTFSGSGASLTSIPNSALVGSGVLTLGSTSMALGSTTTTVTGLTSVTSTGFTGALTGAASSNVLKAGDTMTGYLLLNADPVAALGAVTKQYVDNISAGLIVKAACETASQAPLPTSIYDNGASGVGATLTGSVNGALGAIGGYSLFDTSGRVLIKDQVNPAENGIYVVNNKGSLTTKWVMTRAADFDNNPSGEVATGDFTYIEEGNLAGTQWAMVSYGTIVIGSSAIVFTQLTGAGVITAGTGVDVVGNVVSNAGVLSNVAGSGISVSSATGNVTIANTGVLSTIAGTNISVSGAAGNVTIAVTGTVPSATNIAGGAAGNILYQSGAGATAELTTGTSSQVLVSGTTPSWSNTPTLTGTNFTGVPNSALTNNSLTLGSTSLALGSTTTTVTGLSSVTSTTFVGALTGNASTSTTAGTVTTVAQPNITSVGTLSSLGVSGTVTAGTFSGSGASLTSIPNSALTNSSLTVGTTSISLGSSSTSLGGLTSVTSTSFVGGLTGNASTATTSTNIAGGAAGNILYQSADGATAKLTTGTSSQVLVSGATPAWTNAPTLTGTNFTGIPNGALANSSTTINGTSISLGASGTVTAAAGTLTGTELNATVVSSSLTSVGTITTGVWNGTAIANTKLANSSITVTAGTGMSGGGAVALGSSVTLTNAGVTSIVAGTAISISGGTGAVTVNNTGVTSIAGTTNQITLSASTGGVTVSLPSAVTISGTMTAGAFNATSTERVKEAITNLGQLYLDKFNDLRPREYDRKDYVGHEFGFVAEEMALVYPEIVGRDDENLPSGIDYGRLSAILTAKVQEQQSTIDKLKEQMSMVMEMLKGSM